MLEKIKLAENLKKILYKLFNDFLLILLIFFAIGLFIEGMLPGTFSKHVGLYKIAILVLLDVVLIYLLAKNLKIKEIYYNKKATILALIVFFLLVINSVIKLNIFLILSIIILVSASVLYLNKVLSEEN